MLNLKHEEKMKKLFAKRDRIQKKYKEPLFIDNHIYKLYIVGPMGEKVFI